MDIIKNIFLAFIPIFVAVDAVGVLPLFVSLTHDLEKEKKTKIILQSMITALCLAVGFIFLGRVIFAFLGITIGDFMIGGGSILFCLAMIDLLSTEKQRRQPSEDLGVVPLGTPLIAGPAVLTTTLIIVPEYGLLVTLISVFLNIVFAAFIFSFSEILIKILGDAGIRALSKVTSLLLAAIAVMMIRKGIMHILVG